MRFGGWQLLSVCDRVCLSFGCHPFCGASSVVDPSSYVVVAVVYVLEIVIILVSPRCLFALSQLGGALAYWICG